MKIKHKKFETNENLQGQHYKTCKLYEIPYITVKHKTKWSIVELDNVALPYEINEYIKNNINDNFWIGRFLVNIDVAKGEYINKFGNIVYRLEVKKEYAEKVAEYIFDIYSLHIEKYKKEEEFKMKHSAEYLFNTK